VPVWSSYRFHPTVYAAYLPACANEFPNDNPALHQGARWVCRGPLGAPRALLQAPPGPLSRSLPASSEALPARAAELAAAPPAAVGAPVDAAPPRPRAVELAGPLQLDLSRIVLPHRVADIPPPPDFVFRPFVSSRRRSAEAAACPLPLIGYRVVDARVASLRVERRWRIDIAPCLGVGSERKMATAAAAAETLAQVLFPEVSADPAILEPPAPRAAEPSVPELCDLVAQQLPPASEIPPSKKKQRRRAARVASSASLVAAALPGNAELSRALEELESQFAERRSKPPARNRRQRRAAPVTSEPPPPRRAANAV